MDKALRKQLRSGDYDTRTNAIRQVAQAGDAESIEMLYHIAEGRRRGRIFGSYDARDQVTALECLVDIGKPDTIDYVVRQLGWSESTSTFGPLVDMGSGHLVDAYTSYNCSSNAQGDLGRRLNAHVAETGDGDLYHQYQPDNCEICRRVLALESRLEPLKRQG